MKKLLLLSFAALLVSCISSKSIVGRKTVNLKPEKNISFEVFNENALPEAIRRQQAAIAPDADPPSPLNNLDLPDDLVYRTFLSNSATYKENLNYLVGMVVKKELMYGKYIYTAVQDFKRDSIVLKTGIPTSGVLVERNYDNSLSASVGYLTANAKLTTETAVRLTINDVGIVTIEPKTIDKSLLYDTYGTDQEISKYFLVTGAITTSILISNYTKMQAKAEFDAAAIRVGSNYYKSLNSISQDWKIGMYLVPVSEFLKGYKPPKSSPAKG